MEIVLIRHGESAANAALDSGVALLTGQWDTGLTPNGQQQAAKLKSHPALRSIDAVFASDLHRAMDTARAFAETQIIADSRLRERSLGVFEGRTEQEVRSDPAYSDFFADPGNRGYRHDFSRCAPGGESYSDVCRRVEEFLRDVRGRGYDRIAVVSHFCTIRCILKVINGLSDAETLKINIHNCDPIVVTEKE